MQTFLPCFQLFAQGHGWRGGILQLWGLMFPIQVSIWEPLITLLAWRLYTVAGLCISRAVSVQNRVYEPGITWLHFFIQVRKMTSRFRTTLCYLINSRSITEVLNTQTCPQIPFLDYYENCRIIVKELPRWYFLSVLRNRITLMRIRILFVTLMRMRTRILLVTLMRMRNRMRILPLIVFGSGSGSRLPNKGAKPWKSA